MFSGDYNDLANKPTIPIVVDNLTSTSSTDALSVRQGNVLDNKVTSGYDGFSKNINNGNLNELTKTGFYCGNSVINAPHRLTDQNGKASGYVIVTNHYDNGGYTSQEFISYDDMSWSRTRKGGTWTSWEQFNKYDAITLALPSNTTVTISTAWTNVLVPFQSTKYSYGNGLTRSGSKVIIGKGISLVKVSYLFGWFNSDMGGDISMTLFCNGTAIYSVGYSNTNDNYAQLSGTGFYMSVSEGDEIILKLSRGNTGTFKLFSSYMTVEVIK